MNEDEFREIAHSGGRIVIKIGTDKSGQRGYQLSWIHDRPVRSGIFAIYALPQGVPVCGLPLGGIGSRIPPPPIPGCYMVYIGSDSEGMYGHECHVCGAYWRDQAGTTFCVKCGMRGDIQDFMTEAQRSYVVQYCAKLHEILRTDIDGEHVIDMDAVADAAGRNTEKPSFYYAEESQQNKFKCHSCKTVNDILGIFGYCSRCGTRNDLQELSEKIVPAIRKRINEGAPYEACVRDSVSAFDTLAGHYVEQLINRVPMTKGRKNKLKNGRFHNLDMLAIELNNTFDINIMNGINPDDVAFAKLMFCRRHIYEHKGGEADQIYIEDSGDTAVRPGQALRETQESAHRIAGLIVRIAENLHRGFHEIIMPEHHHIPNEKTP